MFEKWLQINNTCCVCREPIPEMKKDKDGNTDEKDMKNSAVHVNAVNDTNALANLNVNTNDTNVTTTEEEVVEQTETSPRITFSTANNNNNHVMNSGSLNRASVTNTVISSGVSGGT